jgi:hypothetical protein
VFDPTSTIEELLTALIASIDGQSLLQEAFLLQHPSLPSGYFDGALVIDNLFAVSALPMFVSANQEDLYIIAYVVYKILISEALGSLSTA